MLSFTLYGERGQFLAEGAGHWLDLAQGYARDTGRSVRCMVQGQLVAVVYPRPAGV